VVAASKGSGSSERKSFGASRLLRVVNPDTATKFSVTGLECVDIATSALRAFSHYTVFGVVIVAVVAGDLDLHTAFCSWGRSPVTRGARGVELWSVSLSWFGVRVEVIGL